MAFDYKDLGDNSEAGDARGTEDILDSLIPERRNVTAPMVRTPMILPEMQRNNMAASYGYINGDTPQEILDNIEYAQRVLSGQAGTQEDRADVYFNLDAYTRAIREETITQAAGEPLQQGETIQSRALSVLDQIDESLLNPINTKEVMAEAGVEAPGTNRAPGEAVDVNHPQRLVLLQEAADSQDIIGAAASAVQAETDPSWSNMLVSAFQTILLPFGENALLKDFEEALTGKEAPTFSWTKNRKNRIREAIEKMPPEDFKKMVPKLINDLSEANAYLGADMDMSKVHLLEEFASGQDYTFLGAALDTVIDILDATVVAGIAYRTVKLGGKLGSRTTRADELVESADIQKTLGAPDPRSAVGVANATGSNPQALTVVYGNSLPKLTEVLANSSEPRLWLNGMNPSTTPGVLPGPDPDILELSRRAYSANLTDVEKSARVQKEVDALNETKGMKLYEPATVTVKNDDTGTFAIRSAFTRADGTTFKTLDEVQWTLQDSGLSVVDEGVYLFKKNPKTGAFEQVDDVSTIGRYDRGSYMVVRDQNYLFDPKDAMAFEDDVVQNWFGDWAGAGARWLGDNAMLFKEEFARIVARSGDQADAVNAALSAPLKEHYFSLSRSSQNRVTQVLDMGDRNKVTYTPEELKGSFNLTDKEVKGYQAARRVSDTQWALDNENLIRRFQNDGVELYRTADDRVIPELESTMVKPLRTLPEKTDDITEALDPYTGKTISIPSKLDMERDIYDEGKYLAELIFPHRMDDGRVVRHVIVTPGKDVQRTLHLNDAVLRYNEGQIHRIYDTKFFVKKVDKRTGEVIETLAATNSKARGGRAVDRLNQENIDPNVRYDLLDDRASAPFELGKYVDLDFKYGNRLKTTQRKRGQVLRDVDDGGNLVGEANMLDANIALVRTVANMGNEVVRSGTIDVLKQRWLKRYGHLLDGDTKGTWPGQMNAIRTTTNRKESSHARLLWRTITHLEGKGTESVVNGYWRNAMNGMADAVDGLSNGKLAGSARDTFQYLGDVNLVNKARTIPFTFYLALNPARQIIVQSSQLLQMAMVSPAQTLKVAQGTASIHFSRNFQQLAKSERLPRQVRESFRKMGESYDKLITKHLRMSPEEWAKLRDYYHKESGLPASIDHNLVVEGIGREHVHNLQHSAFRSYAGQVASALPRLGRRLGYDVGEQLNLSGSYLTAYYRWREAHPKGKLTKAALEDIAADARMLSYNMNQAGKFAWNDGLPGIFMQFMAVPVKALGSILPAKRLGGLGTSTLSGPEKARVLAGNTLLFGSASVGIQNALEQHALNGEGTLAEGLRSLDPETRQLIFDGLIDEMVNKTIDWTLDGLGIERLSSGIEVSGSVAPMGGAMMFTDRIDALMRGDLAQFLGPATGFLFSERGKARTVMREISYIYGAGQKLDDMEKLVAFGRAIGKLPSGSANMLKALWIKEHQKMEGKMGSTDESRTISDAFMYALGFQQEADTSKWNALFATLDKKEQIAELAKDTVGMWALINKYRESDPSNWQEKYKEELEMVYTIPSLVPDYMKEDWHRAIQREIRVLGMKDNPMATLYRTYLEGRTGREFIHNHPTIPEDLKALLLDVYKNIDDHNLDEDL